MLPKLEKSVEVRVENIKKTKWLESIPKILVYSYEKSELIFKIMMERLISKCEIQHEEVYISHGWKNIDGTMRYLMPIGIVGRKNDKSVRLKCDYSVDINFNCSKKDLTQLYLQMFNIDKNGVSCMLLLHTLIGNLTRLFADAGVPMKNLLFILGEKGSMKTALSKNIVNYWNDPKRVWEISFKSTPAAVESFANKSSDSILFVDDFMPSNDSKTKAELANVLEVLERMFGDYGGRRRNQDFTTKPVGDYLARGGCVVTGEYIEGVSSSIARSVICQLTPGSVNGEILEYYQHNRWVHPTFLYHFLDYVTDNYDDIVKNISNIVIKYRRDLYGRFSNARYGEYMAQYYFIIELLENFLSTIVSKDTISGFSERCKNVVYSVISNNSNSLKARDPVYNILSVFHWALNSGRYVVYATDIEVKNEDGFVDYSKAIFFQDTQYVYIYTGAIKTIFKDYENDTGIDITANIEPSKVGEVLSTNGILATSKEGSINRNGIKRPSLKSKDQRRFYKISRLKIEEVFQNGES